MSGSPGILGMKAASANRAGGFVVSGFCEFLSRGATRVDFSAQIGSN
jgi:hypothetical protein